MADYGRRIVRMISAAAVLSACFAQEADADFRHARMGPRPRAMGSAFVSIADDANSVYWNPAGMTQLKRFEAIGCRTSLYDVEGLSNDYVSAVYNLPSYVALGFSWVRLGLEDIYHEDTINMSLAGKVPRVKGLSVGASVKMFLLAAPGYEKYNDPAYDGRVIEPSYDIGIHYAPADNWAIGAVIYNLSEPKMALLRTTQNPDPIHRNIAVGVKYVFRDMLLMTYDIKTRFGDLGDTEGRIGGELWFFDTVALRGGFKQDRMTAGLGLRHTFWQLDIMLETHNELGNMYQLSATIRL
ncbi:MAG: hypothetical protein GF417_12300 [Candidatus Latescibacteria bacterium]|nr:hypothetical protein [Candidatus Latescibacterota bacterium]